MRPWLEITAVLLAAVVHLVATLVLSVRGLDIALIGAGFVAYGFVRARQPDGLASWGLRREGFRACARDAAVLVAIGAVGCAAIGAARGTLVVDLHLVPPLILYPVWGVVQQTLVLGLVARNLDALGAPRTLVLVLAALGFAAVHLPDLPLCAATAVFGGVCAHLFFRHGNTWPLGIAHGWLGALFYRWVLGRDVWAELMRTLG